MKVRQGQPRLPRPRVVLAKLAGASLQAMVLAQRFLPETSTQTLEEIEEALREPVGVST